MPELHVYSRPELPGFDEALKELQEAVGALPGTGAAPRKVGQAEIDAKCQAANQLGERNALDWDQEDGEGVRLAAALQSSGAADAISGPGVKRPGGVASSSLLFPRITDQKHTIQVESTISSCEWSKKRAWHGQEVKLLVAAVNVADGAKLEIRVFPVSGGDSAGAASSGVSAAGLTQASSVAKLSSIQQQIAATKDRLGLGSKAALHEIKDTLKKNRFEVAWKIDLRKAKLSGACREFYFEAELPELGLKKRSPLLWIDLDGLSFSM